MHDEVAKREELIFAVNLIRSAGELTLESFGKPLTITRKEDGSPVTTTDLEVESFIRSQITEKYPDDSILGEEAGPRPGSSDRCWMIDPIDGTYSFVHGVPLYGVMLGLSVAGEPHLGVINLPALGELIYAVRDGGCFWNEVPARVSSKESLNEALLLSTDFMNCEKRGFGGPVTKLQQRVAAVRTWGDCYGHVLVATGRAEVMLDPLMKSIDCAILMPIVEEAGGTFTDWRGHRTIYGGDAISTNRSLHASVIQSLAAQG
jgi:histidinol phosphatase-like enzyme (inositol monophosphatase family)